MNPVTRATRRFESLVEAACVAATLFLALGIRIVDLTDAPLDFHPARQLHSAIIARGMYFQNLESAGEWQRVFTTQQRDARGLIEPPIMELLSSGGYHLLGGEALWLPRLLSITFWLLGGVGLYLLMRGVTGRMGAGTSLLFYLFAPYSILASRAFMPDPLMTSLITWSVLLATRWARSASDGRVPSWSLGLASGAVTGVAILSKSVAVFALLPVWIAVLATGPSLLRALRTFQTWVIAALAVLPTVLFYAYGILITGKLQQQFSGRFFPSLWVEPRFYVGWLGNVEAVIGAGWLVFSLLGALALNLSWVKRLSALSWLV